MAVKRVQSPTTGAVTNVWAVDREIWAQWHGISGNTFVAAQAVQNKTTVRCTIRATEITTKNNRIQYQGKQYQIDAVLPDNDPVLLTLMLSTLDT